MLPSSPVLHFQRFVSLPIGLNLPLNDVKHTILVLQKQVASSIRLYLHLLFFKIYFIFLVARGMKPTSTCFQVL